METLDEYLTDQFHSDRRDLDEVNGALGKTISTLVDSFAPRKGWSYQIKRDEKWEPPSDFSHSTTAMVLLSLSKLLQAQRSQNLTLDRLADLSSLQSRALRLIAGKMTRSGRGQTWSGTYGKNDVFTLAYLGDLCTVLSPEGQPGTLIAIKRYVRSEGRRLISLVPEQTRNFFKDSPNHANQNAFVQLRAVQAIRSAHPNSDLPGYQRYFESTLHNQLSFTSIPDSRFDPAELTFCLEGLILSQRIGEDPRQRSSVDQSLFKRVVEVLTATQEGSPSWRPTKPFLSTPQGMALFPISVEVANSLLRSCELADGRKLYNTFGSASIDLFRRYWRWLRARTVRFSHKDQEYVGWHSEHVNDPDLIHIWETSQVIEFLLNLRRVLQAHIARTTLIRSHFTIRNPKANGDWSKTASEDEPVTVLGNHYQIYERMRNDFVQGWRQRAPNNLSMLLYGPPGTGKTRLAKKLSDALDLRMITITVSDFLTGGNAQVEAKAKAIFDVLGSQSDCLVLFDEIDNFLLDRNFDRYNKQDTVFQFMTPGMLTKLADLRDNARVLFVVATNYANRIDPAIKRSGRMDKRYLLLPPDMAARRRIMQNLLEEMELAKKLRPSDRDWARLTDAALFLGYKDIEGAIGEVSGLGAKSVGWLVQKLNDLARTTDLSSYANRFDKPLPRELPMEAAPMEEFLCMLGLALELNHPAAYPNVLHRKSIVGAATMLADEIREGGYTVDVQRMGERVLQNIQSIASRFGRKIASELFKALRDSGANR